jgi:nitronate monooxygenase
MKTLENMPVIVQGGMGVGVSNWNLAKNVSRQGQLGVVSGTALGVIVARRLQLGDLDGSIRRALSHFPWPDISQRVLDAYFVSGGKPAHTPFTLSSVPSMQMDRSCVELMIIGNFVEVFLAKEGHAGLIGINYLEKIQLPTLPSLLGAMLGGADFILMGAGIPISIPGILDRLSCWEKVELTLHVDDNSRRGNYSYHFDPQEYFSGPLPRLSRPKFLAIVSSEIIAKVMNRKATGFVDGFIVENHTAGGHNAPPRKDESPTTRRISQFGQKDVPNIAKIRELGKPFWLAGGYASPMKLKEALNFGANGIQVGTAFAFCNESGILPEIKHEVLRQYMNGSLQVLTDFQASPTGYPFKVIKLKNMETGMAGNRERERICDLCYLRQPYCKGDAEVGYRCAGEPLSSYLLKGGGHDETIGKQCLCNGLLATIGLGQIREDGCEIPIVTAGEDFSFITSLVKNSTLTYSAADVIDYLKK